MKTLPTILAVGLLMPEAFAQPGHRGRGHSPVFSGPRDLSSCGVAVVKGLGQGRHLTVRSGPAGHFRRLDRLAAGEHIYVCNEHLEWGGVFLPARMKVAAQAR